MKKYTFNSNLSEISVDKIGEFIGDCKHGKIKKSLKTNMIPLENDGPVLEIVGKNFEEVVRNKQNDVLVLFYAPWSGDCKKLKPMWEELATAFTHVNHL